MSRCEDVGSVDGVEAVWGCSYGGFFPRGVRLWLGRLFFSMLKDESFFSKEFGGSGFVRRDVFSKMFWCLPLVLTVADCL